MSLAVQLEKIWAKSSSNEIDPFIADFCEIWVAIHQTVQQQKILKISKTAEIAQKLKYSHTVPFYEKYSHYDFIEEFSPWMERLATFCIKWKGGWITFPLRLITYELAYCKDNLVNLYQEKLLVGEINGNINTLFSFLFPKLLQMALPMSITDVRLLQTIQSVYTQCKTVTKGPTVKEFVSNIPEITPETIRNKLEQLPYFQIMAAANFLDMGKLGYETHLIAHSSLLPPQFTPYCLLSANLGSTQLSILQTPLGSTSLFRSMKEFLVADTPSSHLLIPLSRRIHSWNLTSLNQGKNKWIIPFAFFYDDVQSVPSIPRPTLDLSLDPSFDQYRPLTNADIDILTFLTTVGSTIRIKDLSSQLKLHQNTVTKLLKEYEANKIIQRVCQFYNIGLDFQIYFYLNIPRKEVPEKKFPFIEQCQTLPRVDIFTAEEKEKMVYFGRVDIPQQWVREFTTRMHSIRQNYPEITLHYSMEPTLIRKWNLSLKETYTREKG